MRAIYKRSKRLRLRIGSDPGAVRDAMQLTITKVAVRRAQRQSNEDWNVPAPETKAIKVELVWDPPWTSDRMSEAARRQFGAIDRPHASTPTGREDVPDVAGAPCDQHVLHWRYAALLVTGRLRPLMELL